MIWIFLHFFYTVVQPRETAVHCAYFKPLVKNNITLETPAKEFVVESNFKTISDQIFKHLETSQTHQLFYPSMLNAFIQGIFN